QERHPGSGSHSDGRRYETDRHARLYRAIATRGRRLLQSKLNVAIAVQHAAHQGPRYAHSGVTALARARSRSDLSVGVGVPGIVVDLRSDRRRPVVGSRRNLQNPERLAVQSFLLVRHSDDVARPDSEGLHAGLKLDVGIP